ncbi:MAG: ATP-binding protein [Planctomycetota bacterium]
MYIKRDMEKVIMKAARQFPAVILTGPRQSGKTTLLKHLFSSTHKYVSLDDPDTRLMAKREPELFFENHKPPVIIDEVQNTPEIFSHIKMLIDSNRMAKGRFLLTGSQSFPLMNKVSESLAGRMAVLTLLNISYSEQFGKSARLDQTGLQNRVLLGGYPELLTARKPDVKLWFSSYMQTYLERDVRQLRQIGDLTDFQRFLEILAAFNGQIVNLSSLSRDLGVAVNTIKSWVSILEASHQIVLLKPYYRNKGKRIIKSPKIYFLDTGLLCYICGITSTDRVFKGPGSGQMFETMILGELMRQSSNMGEQPRIYYWRTSYGEEVDFIVERGGKIILIEAKMTSRVNSEMAKNIRSFCSLFQELTPKGILVTLAGPDVALGNGISAISFSKFIRTVNRPI